MTFVENWLDELWVAADRTDWAEYDSQLEQDAREEAENGDG